MHFLQSEAKMQVVSEAKDNLRKDDDVRWQWSGATWTTEGCPQGERGGVHQSGVPPKPARRDSAIHQREASPQVVGEAKDNMAGVDFVCLRFASAVLANGSMSSNQSGDCPARSAMKTPKAKPQSLARQRDIRRALIEADLVDTALRDRAFRKSEAIPQVLSEAKNNMVALPGQIFYSTQIRGKEFTSSSYQSCN